ncbi:unnamed protein product [Cyprideis torosa]|uniref:Uncharacterized protein n=1 Tax=Cyprideis torosa TaxID=163714 RepID=A0A7R8WMZ6_9CRUS|nr:unnamed protein product [Cyprideis torosa]CAG0903450.1 unnamed protein product [Cyprideis torosa]
MWNIQLLLVLIAMELGSSSQAAVAVEGRLFKHPVQPSQNMMDTYSVPPNLARNQGTQIYRVEFVNSEPRYSPDNSVTAVPGGGPFYEILKPPPLKDSDKKADDRTEQNSSQERKKMKDRRLMGSTPQSEGLFTGFFSGLKRDTFSNRQGEEEEPIGNPYERLGIFIDGFAWFAMTMMVITSVGLFIPPVEALAGNQVGFGNIFGRSFHEQQRYGDDRHHLSIDKHKPGAPYLAFQE